MSASTINSANFFQFVFAFQLRIFSAFEASPINESTSDGLKYLLSNLM